MHLDGSQELEEALECIGRTTILLYTIKSKTKIYSKYVVDE